MNKAVQAMTNKIYNKSHIFCLVLFLFFVVSSYSQIPEAILTNQNTSASVKNEKLTILRSYEILINNLLRCRNVQCASAGSGYRYKL